MQMFFLWGQMWLMYQSLFPLNLFLSDSMHTHSQYCSCVLFVCIHRHPIVTHLSVPHVPSPLSVTIGDASHFTLVLFSQVDSISNIEKSEQMKLSWRNCSQGRKLHDLPLIGIYSPRITLTWPTLLFLNAHCYDEDLLLSDDVAVHF